MYFSEYKTKSAAVRKRAELSQVSASERREPSGKFLSTLGESIINGLLPITASIICAVFLFSAAQKTFVIVKESRTQKSRTSEESANSVIAKNGNYIVVAGLVKTISDIK